jgi:hypothetical protein
MNSPPHGPSLTASARESVTSSGAVSFPPVIIILTVGIFADTGPAIPPDIRIAITPAESFLFMLDLMSDLNAD